MPLGGAPDSISVEIGFASDPLTPLASMTWTDITQYVRRFNTHHGRQHELGRVEAGTATLTLDNKDRRFDPTNTSSPYSPNVVPLKRIRGRATYNAITYGVFAGYIEAWPLRWPTVSDSTVELKVVDASKVLSRIGLRNAYQVEVMKDSPTAYYRTGENDAQQMVADSSGNGHHGIYSGSPTFGEPSPMGSGGTTFPYPQSFAQCPAQMVSGTGAFSFVAWVRMVPHAVAAPPDVLGGYVLAQADASLTTTLGSVRLRVEPANLTVYTTGAAGVTSDAVSPTNITDQGWHQVAFTRSGTTHLVYIDGVQVANSTLTARNITGASLIIGTSPENAPFGSPITEVSIYNGVALSGARIAALYAAGNVWLNDTSGARVNHILDQAGWPAADRAIDTGGSILQSLPAPSGALTELSAVADAESGLVFQAPDGKMTFFQRSHLVTVAASKTSQATFGDGAGELPYLLDGIDPVMDDLDLWNEARVTRAGGVQQIAKDGTSQTKYGLRVLDQTGLTFVSDNEAADRATWLVGRYKSPAQRVRHMTITPWSDPANLWPQALGRGLWDRITFKRRPPGGGPVFSQDSLIEAIGHEYSKESGWKTHWALSPAEDVSGYLILDDAVKGLLGTGKLAA